MIRYLLMRNGGVLGKNKIKKDDQSEMTDNKNKLVLSHGYPWLFMI